MRVVVFFLMISSLALGQSLDNITKAKWLKASGGINANTVYYNGESSREPFTYFVNGSLNLNFKGVFNLPLSFSYTNQEFDFPRPITYNRLSLTPSYKWVKAYIGDVNMTFSPYTLSGHQFTGAGIELTPSNFPVHLSAMYGRLLKAVEYNENTPELIPAYERTGYGLQLQHNSDQIDLTWTFFKALDDANSLQNALPTTTEVTPMDNAVSSLLSSFKVYDKLSLNTEFAFSAVTQNTLETTQKDAQINLLDFLLDQNATTQYYKAFNIGLDYPVASGSVGVNYERVDPEYQTLGAYFFNNDLENITVNASQQLFNNKVNVSVNGGVQRDDLDNTKATQLQRVVTAFSVGLTPNEKLNITTNYSNFTAYTNIKNQFDYINEVSFDQNLDTLDLQQIWNPK